MPRSEDGHIGTRIMISPSNGLYPLASGLSFFRRLKGGSRATKKPKAIGSQFLNNNTVEQFVKIHFLQQKNHTILFN